MKIGVVGTGYVGLVVAASMASVGHTLFCHDIDHKKIDLLTKGEVPFYEPNLKEMVVKHRERMHFTTDLSFLLSEAEILFLALPTPSKSDGSADLSHLEKVALAIGQSATKDLIIICKSTAPVGTARHLQDLAATVNKGPFTLKWVVSPEFLKEGQAVNDFLRPSRILLGLEDKSLLPILERLYAPFNFSFPRLQVMSFESAELAKYAANAMLATRISFMNSLSRLAEIHGADIHQVRKAIGSDPRIGPDFLYAGIGFGGSCFPKDLAALISMFKSEGLSSALFEAVLEINQSQRLYFLSKLFAAFDGNLEGKTIALWGLSFKPDTDDLREAPALDIIPALLKAKAKLHLYDPLVAERVASFFPEAITFKSPLEAASGADAVLLLTEWKEFCGIDLSALAKTMNHPLFFDGRNQYDPEAMEAAGINYQGMGLGKKQKDLCLCS